MDIIKFPERKNWQALMRRPAMDTGLLEKKVSKILESVRNKGDKAVKKYTRTFDGISLRKLEVTEKEMKSAIKNLSPALKEAMQLAKKNIEKFHQSQVSPIQKTEISDGITCWQKSVGIEKVGLYIPGGTAPLFSTILMLGIPAGIAGCEEIILCSPPGIGGALNPAILYAASIAGITKIFKSGGAQAIAAMAYGTETIPRVYKIFGPGNQYVTCAKQQVQKEGLAIDMPAGPSELAIYADETADAGFVAADLLSQAEHGTDSQVILVTTSEKLIRDVMDQLRKQAGLLSRKELIDGSLSSSRAILFKDEKEAVEWLNAYAPEHLILNCDQADRVGESVRNAGSVFIGPYSPESAGDYASGTNHTLPTNGYARAYSGVNVDSFVRKISFQKLNETGLKTISSAVIQMAEAEGLQAHANAVRIRFESKF